MADIQLIATDLDGTLIGRENEFSIYGAFRECIDDIRREKDVTWIINTGRSLKSFRSYYAPMWSMGILPDYVVVDHAYIYSVTRLGFVPHTLWSLRIRFEQWFNRVNARRAVMKWHEMITKVTGGVSTVRKKKDRLWLSFETEESAASAARLLKEKAAPYKHLKVFRYLKDVDVRYVPFTKGMAITELGRRLKIAPENILVIGDGHNDASMMEEDVAFMTGCPANSVPELMEIVHDRSGHISSKPSLAGVMEIIYAYYSDAIDSALPDGWKHSADRDNPMPRKSAHSEKQKSSCWICRVMLGLIVIYTVLLVFANYGLLGPVSGLIKKPFMLLLNVVMKTFSI